MCLASVRRRNPSAPQFQLRLFCTSSDNHQPNNTYGYTHRQPIPIEFPAACEAKVNDCPIPGSLKGIKKKPGTAAPANVTGAKFPSGHARAGGFALRLDSANDSNTVALHYANTEKQHYMVVYLVEYTPVDMVAERIRTNKVRTKEEVIKSRKLDHMSMKDDRQTEPDFPRSSATSGRRSRHSSYFANDIIQRSVGLRSFDDTDTRPSLPAYTML